VFEDISEDTKIEIKRKIEELKKSDPKKIEEIARELGLGENEYRIAEKALMGYIERKEMRLHIHSESNEYTWNVDINNLITIINQHLDGTEA